MPPDSQVPVDRLVRELQGLGRVRIPLEQLRAAFARACPELAEMADRRTYLNQLIQEAVIQGTLKLPRSRAAYDRLGTGALPAFVMLPKDPVAAPAVVSAGYAWHPLLAFATRERSQQRLECLRDINEWLKRGPDLNLMVPVKERSLEIFADEKRIDRLRGGRTSLFDEQLPLRSLACRICPIPLPVEIGPEAARGRPILVVENNDTWDSFCTWNRKASALSAVAYAGGGHGKGLAYDETFLDELLARCLASELLYFGDLDPMGISIGAGATRRRADRGVAPMNPAIELYSWLLEHGTRQPFNSKHRSHEQDLAWLPMPLRADIHRLFVTGHRIPQESLGLRILMGGSPPLPWVLGRGERMEGLRSGGES